MSTLLLPIRTHHLKRLPLLSPPPTPFLSHPCSESSFLRLRSSRLLRSNGGLARAEDKAKHSSSSTQQPQSNTEKQFQELIPSSGLCDPLCSVDETSSQDFEDTYQPKTDFLKALAVLAAAATGAVAINHSWVAANQVFFISWLYSIKLARHNFRRILAFNKSGVGLLMAAPSVDIAVSELTRASAEVSEIVFFLLGAMTIVEIVDAHQGFKLVTDNITTRKPRTLLWVIGLVTFFLSSVLDNLTSTIIMVSLLRKLVPPSEYRKLLGAVVVIAANAGGAWTPIGDVTTTMLWIHGQISTLQTMKVDLPSLGRPKAVRLALGWLWDRELDTVMEHFGITHPVNLVAILTDDKLNWNCKRPLSKKLIKGQVIGTNEFKLQLGTYSYLLQFLWLSHWLLCHLLVKLMGRDRTLPMFWHLNRWPERKACFLCWDRSTGFCPCVQGYNRFASFHGYILLGLGVLWILTDAIHYGESERQKLKVPQALSRIDTQGALFFLGILLSVSSLEAAGILRELANYLDAHIQSVELIASAIGVVSAIIDNVPLVAATMGMYDLTSFPQDSEFWQLVAYCAGTGGSMLVIGSAAGVAFMGMEKVDFFWYLRKVSGFCFRGLCFWYCCIFSGS
ncbi:sodium:hydrogen antiporter 1 [Actinidia rufa]|uniref:Sodium:hydrogen antiporter 1 n=1 Tax=Actinidia rufa TaxID=165716 RepID=A0A7J0DAE8_9ERIC|nr:sodium:hydrogen antiporter 1 [Actinidia rufa]